MAIWNVTEGTALGRGFAGVDPTGVLSMFYSWVSASPATSAGPGWYIYDDNSTSATDPYIVVTDTSGTISANAMNISPDSLPPKFIKVGMISTEAGYIRVQHYLWWNKTTHLGHGLWCGHRVATYDSATFEYRFRAGQYGLVIHTRLASTWYMAGILSWEGDNNLVEDTSKYGILQSSAAPGTNVTVQLGSGQASNFTVNNSYFIMDFQDHTWANYTKCLSANSATDQVVFDTKASNFITGSVVAAYAHRFYAFGTLHDTGINDICGGQYYSFANASYAKIPYQSSTIATSVIHNQSGQILGAASLDVLTNTLATLNPDDLSLQAVMRPIVIEYEPDNASTPGLVTFGLNRAYGQVKHMYAAYNNSFLKGSDGKVINGLNYLYFASCGDFILNGGNLGNFAALFLDSESST